MRPQLAFSRSWPAPSSPQPCPSRSSPASLAFVVPGGDGRAPAGASAAPRSSRRCVTVGALASPEGQVDSGVGVYPALAPPGAAGVPERGGHRGRAALRARRARVEVAFAVADERGGVSGLEPNRTFLSASLTKAMLLVALLRRPRRGADRVRAQSLGYMIRLSDNASADRIYARVGNEGLFEVARRAGMSEVRGLRPLGERDGDTRRPGALLPRGRPLVPRARAPRSRARCSRPCRLSRRGACRTPPGRVGARSSRAAGARRTTASWCTSRRCSSEAARRVALAVMTTRRPRHGLRREDDRGGDRRLLATERPRRDPPPSEAPPLRRATWS